jgi:pilus assembly protein CpaE
LWCRDLREIPLQRDSPYHAVDARRTRGNDMIRVLIADQISRIVGDLEKLAPYGDVIDVCGVAHQPSRVMEEAWLRQPDVLLLHQSFAGAPIGDLGAHLESTSPATRVLVMTEDGTPPGGSGTAMIGESAGGAELVEAIRAAAATPPPDPRGDESQARDGGGQVPEAESGRRRAHPGRASLIVVFSGKGGAGCSMVAANLAVALAGGTDDRSALIDADLQFGDVAATLGVESHVPSIADLAVHGDDIATSLLDTVLATGAGGVRVLRAAPSPELAGMVTAAGLRSIIRAISKAHAFVVVDTPSQLDERTLELFELADRVLLVSSYSMASVRSTKAMLDVLDALGVAGDRVDIVLNHTRPRVTLRREAVEERLGRRAQADLPHDPGVDQSLDSGVPIVLGQCRGELSRQLLALAQRLAPASGQGAGAPIEIPPSPPLPSYRRRFSLGRR